MKLKDLTNESRLTNGVTDKPNALAVNLDVRLIKARAIGIIMKKSKFTSSVLTDLHFYIEEDLSDVLDNMSSYPDEIEFIRQCLKKIDIDFSHLMC